MFDELRQGLQQIAHLTDSSVGELRLGCPDIVTAGLMPALIERFLRRFPKVRLHVVHAETGAGHFQQLRERHVDLLIGRLPMHFGEDDLAAERVFDETFVALAAQHNPWAHRRRIELADLLGEAWTLPPYDSVPGGLIAGMFRAAGLEPPRASVVTLSASLSVVLVATGNFVGILPSSVVRFNAKRLSLKALPVSLPERISMSIITVRKRTLSPLAQLFIAFARAMAEPLA